MVFRQRGCRKTQVSRSETCGVWSAKMWLFGGGAAEQHKLCGAKLAGHRACREMCCSAMGPPIDTSQHQEHPRSNMGPWMLF